LVEQEVDIYAVILDKQSAEQPIETESWYRAMFTELICHAIGNRPGLQIMMDRRYTKHSLQMALIQSITERQSPGTAFSITAEDSTTELALQIADIVAWSIFHKYEHNSPDFHCIIASRITKEMLVIGWN
jgi:hypothetical protein